MTRQIPEPVFTPGMTAEQIRETMDRYLAECTALAERLDEESLILGMGWSASVCAAHEATQGWLSATADRWYRALPERYMTPDSLRRPDWNHSHYLHDGDGHMVHPVITKQRPETEQDRQAAARIREILQKNGQKIQTRKSR